MEYELESFREWLAEQFPKEIVTVLDTEKYKEVANAMGVIYAVSLEATADDDDCDKPVFNARFDRLYGTDLGFSVEISNAGIRLIKKQIDAIYDSLPDNVLLSITPLLDERTRVSFTFRNVKRILSAQ